MKYAILVGDGMADYPIPELDNRTPLEAAATPNMDSIARSGMLGLVKTIPDEMAPASDVANMSILGYAPEKYYSGRGPLEAASLGIELGENDIAFRCNLVTVANDILEDYSASHISTEEARELIEALNQDLGRDDVQFYCGVSYRHLLVIRDGQTDLLNVYCFPPHDIVGERVAKHWPSGAGSESLVQLMEESRRILEDSRTNQMRVEAGKNSGNMIWLWGQGRTPNLPTYFEEYHLTGSVITAVDLLKGMGKLLGLEVINVPGATGYYDTDYEAKAKAATKALENKDFVFVHVEAPDEAGHVGDLKEKITAIERFDHYVVGELLSVLQNDNDLRLMVLPDHPTPLSVRTHTREPVPFAVAGHGISRGSFSCFSEREAHKGGILFVKGYMLTRHFLTSSHAF